MDPGWRGGDESPPVTEKKVRVWEEIFYGGHLYKTHSVKGKEMLGMSFDKVEQTAGVHTTVSGTLYEPLALPSERTRPDRMASWGRSSHRLL